MADIPTLLERVRRIHALLEELEELDRRLGVSLPSRANKYVDLIGHGLEVVEGLLFYLSLDMRMAKAQYEALERLFEEKPGDASSMDLRARLLTDAEARDQLGIPSIDLDACEITREVVIRIPREIAVKHQLVAFGWIDQDGRTYLQVAMVDPTHIFAKDDVEFAIGHEIKIYVASEEQIARAITKYYPRPDPERA